MKTRSQSRVKSQSNKAAVLLQKPASDSAKSEMEVKSGSKVTKAKLTSKAKPRLIGKQYPQTLDGRYFVVKGKLWRCSNPSLNEETRQELVNQLMVARRNVGLSQRKGDPDSTSDARSQVNEAKIALGERGPVWWEDGAKDYNKYLVKNTPYKDWYEALGD